MQSILSTRFLNTARRHSGVRSRFVSRLLACCLASVLASCTSPGPAPTPFRIPTFDSPSALELLQDAIAETGSGAAATPPPLVLPPSLTDLMNQNRIQIRPLPTQATQICRAMGVPGADNLAGEGVTSILRRFRPASDDLRSGIGVLITVVFTSCSAWMPLVESAIRDLF